MFDPAKNACWVILIKIKSCLYKAFLFNPYQNKSILEHNSQIIINYENIYKKQKKKKHGTSFNQNVKIKYIW